MEIITLKDLNFTYPEQSTKALDDVNLSVEKGDFFVLCGYSGCGKTTLLRLLKPAIAPHGTIGGSVLFKGTPVTELNDEISASEIGFVMQSPEHQVVTDKVWHELAFGLESLGCDTPTIRRRTAETAAIFGMEDQYHKNVSELSGGQKQLLCLASVMVMQPEVLILDEPTAQLDPIAASEFLGMLQKINRELGTTVLLCEHRLEEVLTMATKAAVMDRGHIEFAATPKELGLYLKSRKSDLFAAMPTALRVWGSVESDAPSPISINEGKNFLRNYTEHHPIHPLTPPAKERTRGKERIRASEAWFRYEKALPDTVKGLEFSAYAGELFCILGGNGGGKTTTLKLLAGIKNPYRGEIERNGSVALLPQDPQTVFLKKTVREDLTDVLKAKGADSSAKDAVRDIAALCKITDLLDRHPYDLSGGEQQRAALAKVLLLSPDILLIDEPTKGLDIPFQSEFAEILQKLKNRGVCIIMVSHDIEFCAKYADRCGLFFDGHIVTQGTPAEFFAGNSFYTTAAARMASEIEPNAVTAEDIISVIGGKQPTSVTEEQAPVSHAKTEAPAEKKLPRWRKAGACLTGLGAFGFFLYASGSGDLRILTERGGITPLGIRQLVIYGGCILCLILLAVFLGRRSPPPTQPIKKQALSKRTVVAASLILLLIPLTLWIGIVSVPQKQYYITALAVLLECMLPFFLIFEGRKPKARELVTIAVLCTLAVAGRAVFFMLPQFKPVMAITVIAGVAFGGETGFLVGAGTMLVSNILFAQGPWTPWQMFAMGIIGFLAGVLYKKGILRRSKASLCIFGALSAMVIYGGIMNPASALIWGSQSLNAEIILGYYISGIPMDAIHAAATALFLYFGAEPMLEKLDRIKLKYGMME